MATTLVATSVPACIMASSPIATNTPALRKEKTRSKLLERRVDRKRTLDKIVDVLTPQKRKSLPPSPLLSPGLSSPLPQSPLTPSAVRSKAREGFGARCTRRHSANSAAFDHTPPSPRPTPSKQSSMDTYSSSSTLADSGASASSVVGSPQSAPRAVLEHEVSTSHTTRSIPSASSVEYTMPLAQVLQREPHQDLLSNELLLGVAIALAVAQVALLMHMKGVCPLS
ncbi:hypothetical protein BKA62DRAFT_757563 [Auriculariales sp. MPI-PUGE-AT-0066]|nr:hypothetical protein BKA62DRAFT_757563 [Auriculariales sp. MPI-PUGE-AT-0066]